MVHDNFHVVEAADALECSARLGRLFGPKLAASVTEAREQGGWRELKREARDLLDATSLHFPAYVRELEAYAAAAGLSLLDVWTISVEDEIGGDDAERCTTVVTNGGRLIAHNEDWEADSAKEICVLKKVVAGVTSLELYYYGSPLGATALFVSGQGHVQAINSLDHDDWQVGVPKIVVARRLADAKRLEDELAGVLAVPRSSGFAHTLVERSGSVTIVECSAKRHTVTHPSLPWAHTNHFVSAGMERQRGGAANASSRRRLELARAAVQPKMSPSALEDAMAAGGGRGAAVLCNRNTIARAVIDLDANRARIWLLRENQKGWCDYGLDFAAAVTIA